MLNLVKIAVTGGLSSGKSTVCHLFQHFGAYVVSADEIVHHLLTPQTEVGQKIVGWLGSEIVRDNEIDRAKLAQKVFGDSEKLKKLESLLHPLVRQEISKAYLKAQAEKNVELFVAEIPLLFEAKMEKDFDYTLTVSADENVAKSRFNEKFTESDDEWSKRNSFQMPLSEKERRSDFVIFNNGSYEELKLRIQKLYNHLKKHESRRNAL